MKKLLNAILAVLAMNFLVAAGGVGYLVKTGALDREKVTAIKALLFPPPPPPGDPTTQPVASADDPTTQPALRLEELLRAKAGVTAGEQVDFIRQTFDAQAVQLDRRRRELQDLQRQVDLAKAQVARDRQQLDEQRASLREREQRETALASDKGFQDSLTLYQVMPGKQVKTIFMALGDDVVIRYLQAMPASGAKKIIKEFKSPEEVARIQSVMEKMRQASADAPPANGPAKPPAAPAAAANLPAAAIP
ncbi:MAG TPA: hypothetical protein VK324_17565, partial [Tepidisphaeraceae bacterium]|nr:hypothetical protein [Tepidisphaeraceae bacterium]